MTWTPEQLDQIQHAKATGAGRVTLNLTATQRQDWQAEVEAEMAGKDENVTRFLKIKAAAERPGFFGDVRRAILLSRRPLAELAAAVGVEAQALSDFRAGEAELPALAIDRLVDALHLRLMQEIPR